MPTTNASFWVFLFLFLLANSVVSFADRDAYAREACSVTRYQDLCFRALSPFASTAKNSPSRWARAGVSVTITEAHRVVRYLTRLNASVGGRRGRVALSDCLDLYQDALDGLHRSLSLLRALRARNFEEQMSDLTTWLSAALTDQDTCTDGFGGTRTRAARDIRRRVMKGMYMTSNALALVNKLATTGIH